MNRRPTHLLLSLLLPVLLPVLLIGCGEQDLLSPSTLEADRIHNLVGNGAQTGVAGQHVLNRPAVVARNADGVAVPGVPVQFEVTGGGGSVFPADPVETDSFGVARASSWELGNQVGEYEVTATMVGSSGPGTSTVFRAVAGPGEVDPGESSLVADPRLDLPADGESSAALVLTLRDGHGNGVPGRRMHLQVNEGPAGVNLGSTVLTTGPDGRAATSVRSTESGFVRIGAVADEDRSGPEFASATMNFVPGPIDGSRSVVTASRVRGIVADGVESTTIRILLRDAAGNPRDDLLEGLTVSTDLGQVGQPQASAEPGVYTVELRSRSAGWARVSASLDRDDSSRVEIGGTRVEFVAGAVNAAASSVELGSDGAATVGPADLVDGALVVVILRDEFGNPRLGGEDAVFFEAESGELGEVVWLGEGRYGVRLNSSTVGEVRVTAHAEIDGRRVRIGSTTVEFGAAAPDAQQSTIEIDDTPHPVADGEDVARVTVILRDAWGNAVDAGPHPITLSSSTGSVSTPVMAHSGEWSADLTSTTAGPVAVTAHLTTGDGPVEIGTATGQFQPGPATLLVVHEPELDDGQTGTVGAPLPHSPRVRAIDAFGNPTDDAAVTFSVAAGNGSLASGAPVPSGEDGVATAPEWTLGTTPGEQTMTAHLGDPSGPSVTITADARPGPPDLLVMDDPSETNLQTGTVGYPIPIAPRVLIEDQYGNAVPDASVSFAVASGGGSVSGPGTTVTGSDGVATLETWALGAAEGTNTLEVLSPDLPGESVTFEATGDYPDILDWQNWSASGSTATVSEPSPNEVRLEYAQMSGFSGSWSYAATAGRSETLQIGWDLRYCHSFNAATGSFRIEVDGPSGTQVVYERNGGGCYWNDGGVIEIEVHAGYAVRFLASGSHFDSREELSGRLDLSLAPAH